MMKTLEIPTAIQFDKCPIERPPLKLTKREVNPTDLSDSSETLPDSPILEGFCSSSSLRRHSVDESQCLEDAVVDYKPVGTWIEKQISAGFPLSKTIHMSSSFIPIGMSIGCHSTTNTITISCKGVSKIKILLKGEDQQRKQGPSHLSISEMTITDNFTDDRCMQRITLDLPLPCKTVEVLIVERTLDFVCIFDVLCYSSSVRPSSQSTPIPVLKRRQSIKRNVIAIGGKEKTRSSNFAQNA